MRVFLSASIPDPKRHEKYFKTADVIAIRDAIRALVTIVLPHGRLVWGGHPAITPLVHAIAGDLNITTGERVRLFQSAFFAGRMPSENAGFEKVIVVPAVGRDREASLEKMREAMISSEKFSAGIFIGGMEGVEVEYQMFRAFHPKAKAIPVASTGAAALHIFKSSEALFDPRLVDDYAYPSLFRRLLNPPATRR